jgi:hypothetical protein
MKPKDAIKALGDFHSTDKEDLEAIRESIKLVLDKEKIDEDTLKELNSCERSLALIRIKYTDRLVRLYKAGYITEQ